MISYICEVKKTYHIQKNTLFHQKVKKKYWHLSSWMYIITESVFLCWIWEAGTVKHTYNVFCTFLNIEDATRLNKQFFSLYSLNRLVMQNSWNILVVDQYVTLMDKSVYAEWAHFGWCFILWWILPRFAKQYYINYVFVSYRLWTIAVTWWTNPPPPLKTMTLFYVYLKKMKKGYAYLHS